MLRMTRKLDAKERTPKEEYAEMRSSLRKSGLRLCMVSRSILRRRSMLSKNNNQENNMVKRKTLQ